MSEVEMMITEAKDAIEGKCDCTDGSCSTCYAVGLLYKAIEELNTEK